MPNYRLGELFCGPGGIAYGAMTARIENPDFRIEPRTFIFVAHI